MKLLYYAGEGNVPQRGEAEKIRLFLKECGYPFEDLAIDQATHTQMKEDGTLSLPRLPALQIKESGSWISYESSSNIMEAIATKADAEKKGRGSNKFCGKDGELTKIRAISNIVTKYESSMDFRHGKQDGKEATIKQFLSQIEDMLHWNEENGKNIIGECFTFADISAFAAINATACIYGVETLQDYTRVLTFHEFVGTQARFAMRISNRPDVN